MSTLYSILFIVIAFVVGKYWNDLKPLFVKMGDDIKKVKGGA